MKKYIVRHGFDKGTHSAVNDFERESSEPQVHLSQIKQIYSSKDGLLGVYEDAEGHLVSIDTRNFCS